MKPATGATISTWLIVPKAKTREISGRVKAPPQVDEIHGHLSTPTHASTV